MGFRSRLALVVIVVVACTATTLGAAVYAIVGASLRSSFEEEALRQANFNLAIVAPSIVGDRDLSGAAASEFMLSVSSPEMDVVIEVAGGDPLVSSIFASTVVDQLSQGLMPIVDRGHLAMEWATLETRRVLAVVGRPPGGGPVTYFIFDGSATDEVMGSLARAILVGEVILVLVALVASGWVARMALRPISATSGAAQRIASGDFTARLPVASADEFGQWAETFNEMANSLEMTMTELQEADRRNRRFVADVSHELRTPITALVAEASLLQDLLANLPEDVQRIGQLLAIDARRLRDLVEEIIELSRFDARVESPSAERVDLGTFVSALVARYYPEATVAGPDQPIEVQTDRRRVDLILRNLLLNVRAHAADSAVQVRVGLLANLKGELEACISVADRGPGVRPEDLPRLFDRFYKADSSRHTDGSGLGLAIAAENAALIGGRLTASNRSEGGLNVELCLPWAGVDAYGD